MLTPEELHRLMPLHYFYETSGQPLPEITFLDRSAVPYPYRSLLVHENDMTPTLAAFHHSKLYLEVHRHEQNDGYLIRLVTLHSLASDAPVEYGAIGILLDEFPPEVKELILKGKVPLGGILGEHKIGHTGRPSGFFSVRSDAMISEALHQKPGELLYGRCNQLLDRDGIVIADIVEILPRHSESEQWMKSYAGKKLGNLDTPLDG